MGHGLLEPHVEICAPSPCATRTQFPSVGILTLYPLPCLGPTLHSEMEPGGCLFLPWLGCPSAVGPGPWEGLQGAEKLPQVPPTWWVDELGCVSSDANYCPRDSLTWLGWWAALSPWFQALLQPIRIVLELCGGLHSWGDCQGWGQQISAGRRVVPPMALALGPRPQAPWSHSVHLQPPTGVGLTRGLCISPDHSSLSPLLLSSCLGSAFYSSCSQSRYNADHFPTLGSSMPPPDIPHDLCSCVSPCP